MTAATYRATLARLGLTHKQAADLLDIHPSTSRRSDIGLTAVRLLKLIEHVGVDEARRILGVN